MGCSIDHVVASPRSNVALGAAAVVPTDAYAQESGGKSFFGIFGGKSDNQSSNSKSKPVFVDTGTARSDSATAGIYDNRRDEEEMPERVIPVDPVAAAEARSRQGQMAAAAVFQDLEDKKAAEEAAAAEGGISPTQSAAGGTTGGQRVLYKKPGDSDKKPIRLFNVQ